VRRYTDAARRSSTGMPLACSTCPMKKTNRKKLTLRLTTVRSLLENEMIMANGGEPNVSVGTCTGCRPTYNPTEAFSCRGICV
jgi:hypothetical protein